MVERQLRQRGVASERVLEAMRRVPRHRFVPEAVRSDSYQDHPLPIGFGQTISQPYIVGFMSDALRLEPSHRVLEIGTGSGYQAAILGELVREVYTIEIIPELAARARSVLAELGYRNIHVRAGNGYLGWPEAAPFDRVIVTAAPDEVPPALVAQLRPGGLMAIPVGDVRAGTADPATHAHGHGDAGDAARAIRADDRKAEDVGGVFRPRLLGLALRAVVGHVRAGG